MQKSLKIRTFTPESLILDCKNHLIVKPFNIKTFQDSKEFTEIEVHKNNPTNLYIP